MVYEKSYPNYERSMRHLEINQRASELVGNDNEGNIKILNDLLARMQKLTDINIGTCLELENLDDTVLDPLEGDELRLERGYRLEVNLEVLSRLYSIFEVMDSRMLAEQDHRPDELWLTIENPTSKGFIFKELWGYAPGHTDGDFAPDSFSVIVEAIRQPNSDYMHFR